LLQAASTPPPSSPQWRLKGSSKQLAYNDEEGMQALVEEVGERVSNMLDPVLTREEIVEQM
jgi:hypothetical protein